MSIAKKVSYDSYIKSIGQITVNFAALEDLLAACVNILIGGEFASIITTRMPLPRLLDLLPTIYRHKYGIDRADDLPRELKNLLKRVEEAENMRNDVVHSIWQFGTTQESVTRIKKHVSRRKGFKIHIEPIDLQWLNRVASYIGDTIDEAIDFAWSLLEEYTSLLISPLEGAIVSDFPTFSWTAVDGAVAYELAIARDAGFTQMAVFKQGKEALRETEYTLETKLKHATTYYWMVRPIIADRKGYWSDVRAFRIKQA